MYMKIHQTPKGRIVACCDKELIGKQLKEDNTFLDLEKHKSFYQGELVGEEALERALKSFSSVNLIGERCVKVAKKMDLVTEEHIVKIGDVPHVQIYNI